MNIPAFISSTLLGILNDVNDEHHLKAYSPIAVIASGILIVFRDLQPAKAFLSIVFKVSGSFTSCKLFRSSKQPLPICSTDIPFISSGTSTTFSLPIYLSR